MVSGESELYHCDLVAEDGGMATGSEVASSEQLKWHGKFKRCSTELATTKDLTCINRNRSAKFSIQVVYPAGNAL